MKTAHIDEQQQPGGIASRPHKKSGLTSKIFSCKLCGADRKSKEDLWVHAKTHIPDGKRLTCSKCCFVTEHKHHLMYHINTQHSDIKPFKCAFCGYTCVCKSMLTSHMRYLLNVQVLIFLPLVQVSHPDIPVPVSRLCVSD